MNGETMREFKERMAARVAANASRCAKCGSTGDHKPSCSALGAARGNPMRGTGPAYCYDCETQARGAGHVSHRVW